MLSPNELQVFLAAVEAHSFSGAARKLYLTQPAVSQQIQALERRLRVDLFERRAGHIALTEAGEELLPLARQMVNHALRIQESMAARRGVVTGRLKIGCTTTPGKYILPWLVGSFCQLHPQVQIAVQVVPRSDLVCKLQREEINFGIMSGQVENADLVYDEVMEDELVLAVPLNHPFTKEERVSLDRLRGETIILREEHAGTRVTMLEELESAGLDLDSLQFAPFELGAAEGVIAAVRAGWGISWVSKVAAMCAVEMGKIGIVQVEGLQLLRTIYLVSHRLRIETNAHRKFYEYVRSPEGRAILTQLGA